MSAFGLFRDCLLHRLGQPLLGRGQRLRSGFGKLRIVLGLLLARTLLLDGFLFIISLGFISPMPVEIESRILFEALHDYVSHPSISPLVGQSQNCFDTCKAYRSGQNHQIRGSVSHFPRQKFSDNL